MYQRPRRRIIEEGEAAPLPMPPSWPEEAFPAVVKRQPAVGSSVESQVGKSLGMPVVEIQGIYVISVAARILDMHPQTLRKYERLGLINPGRTIGMLRLYSTEDIRKVRLIRYLSDELGLNLAGVEFALAAFDNMSTIKQRIIDRLEGIPAAQQVVQEEMDLLFNSLNLPVDR